MKNQSNGNLLIQSRGQDALELALRIALIDRPGICAWSMKGAAVLWLFEEPVANAYPLPFAMRRESLVHFVGEWLDNVDEKDRGDYAHDFDGSQKPDGFRIQVGYSGLENSAIEVHAVWSHFHK